MTKVEKTKKAKKPTRAFDKSGARSSNPKLPPMLRERPTDSPALKRARAGFLATLPPFARPSMERLITSAAHRKAFNEYIVPKVGTMAQAKEAFDAAQVDCVRACLGYTDGKILAIAPHTIAAQEAGFAIVAAYAAILRARDAAPIALTAKGEGAQLKSKRPAYSIEVSTFLEAGRVRWTVHEGKGKNRNCIRTATETTPAKARRAAGRAIADLEKHRWSK